MPGSALRGASLLSAASTRLRLPCLQRRLYGPIDELPCPLVGCLGSRFDLLDDVGLIPLEIPNTAAAAAAHFVFRRRVVAQRGWLPLCPSTFGRGIHVDLKAKTGVLLMAGSGSFLAMTCIASSEIGRSVVGCLGLIQSRKQGLSDGRRK
jgi:hypothetical protein